MVEPCKRGALKQSENVCHRGNKYFNSNLANMRLKAKEFGLVSEIYPSAEFREIVEKRLSSGSKQDIL